jgi:thymidylate kinase
LLIILEGPDGAGKSTFAQEIVAHLATHHDGNVTVRKAGPPTRHPLDEYVTPLLEYEPGGSEHIICDRWHVGEWVYPRVKGRPTRMDRPVLNYVEAFLRSKGAVTVVLNPPVATLQDRVYRRGDDYVRVGELPVLHEAYSARELPELPTMSYILGDPHPDRNHVAAVVLQAARCAAAASRFNPFVTPVGSLQPRALILGDVRGCGGGDRCRHTQHHLTSGTAFMPYAATSGHYLLGALEHTSLIHSSVFANACDVDDPTSVWAAYRQPPVVTLGRNAHRLLDLAGLPHASAPHPQFIRRFHHREAERYGKLIESLVGTEEDQLSWRP